MTDVDVTETTSTTPAATIDEPAAAGLGTRIGRIPVTKVSPVIEGGAYAAKASVGEEFEIRATVFREGHDAVNASVIVTNPAGVETEVRMEPTTPLGFDWWHAYVSLGSEGAWTFRVEGWSDPWETWVHNAEIKIPAGIDVSLMITEGTALFHGAAQRARQAGDHDTASILSGAADGLAAPQQVEDRLHIALAPEVREAMIRFGPRELVSPTPDYPVFVDRKRALFSSWYEFFPRSEGAYNERPGDWVSGTFDSSHGRLEAAAAMGFDVVYLPPIHPIGTSFRKGREQHPEAGPGDPGSPWAIGNVEGGHDAIHPDLGDFDAFDRFVARAKELGLEIALDLALNASPDHPWVKEHPEWFAHRADGSIAYAENPPKKYQDIYNFNFDTDRDGIRAAWLEVVRLWMCHGVRIFRVDNPHTKPVAFWAWLFAEVRKTDPDVLFLAEAFTKPAMMHALGKVGFHQGYTYFTWRNEKWELEEYLTELTHRDRCVLPAELLRQHPGHPAHLPAVGWQDGLHDPGRARRHAVADLGCLRRLRAVRERGAGPRSRGVPALREVRVPATRLGSRGGERGEPEPAAGSSQPDPTRAPGPATAAGPDLPPRASQQVIVYSKKSGEDVVITICNLDPTSIAESEIVLDMEALGLAAGDVFLVHDEITGQSWRWGQRAFVRLTFDDPAHVLTVVRQGDSPHRQRTGS